MDTLLSRYSNIDYVMSLSFVNGINLIEKCNISIAEDRLFQQWNMEHIFMEEDNFINFEDYKNKAFNSTKTKKITAKEALVAAEKIKALDQKGGN